jgi:hypothetical protein
LIVVDCTTKVIGTASFIEAEFSSVGTVVVVAVHTAAAFIHGCTVTGFNSAAVHYTAPEISTPATVICTFHFTAPKGCVVTETVTVHS